MIYWILTAALIVFGFITGFSIGQPFLLVGLAMVVLGPLRRRPLVFWPPMAGVIAAVVVFMTIAPFTCSASTVLDGTGLGGATTTTICTSLVGIRYEVEGLVNPSAQPAILIGLVAGVLTALATFAVLRRRIGKGPRSTGP